MALLETLWDDFNDPAASATKWDTTGSVSVTGGNMSMAGTGGGAGQVDSKGAFTFGNSANNSYLVAKLIPFGGAVDFEMMVVDGGSLATVGLYITTANNLVRRTRNTSGTPSQQTIGPYNSTSMRYLRLRTFSATVYFGYSADGITWTEPTNVAFALTSQTANKARFVLNTTPAGRGVNIESVGYTPVEELKETFSTTLDTSNTWTLTGTNTTTSVTGGTFNITSNAGTPQATTDGGLRTIAYYRLPESSLFAQVAPITVTDQAFRMALVNPLDSTGYFHFKKLGTNLQMEAYASADTYLTSLSIPYLSSTHAWWRIRLTGGELYWETSPNSTTWTVRHSLTYTYSNFFLFTPHFTASWTGPPSAYTVSLDNINTSIFAATALPAGINDTDQPGDPTATQAFTIYPDTTQDPETAGSPAVTQAFTVNPDGIADPETADNPTVAQVFTTTVTPDSITDPETVGSPGITTPPKTTASIQDDFAGTTLNPTWNVTAYNSATATVSGGFLNLGITGSDTSNGVYVTTAATDYIITNSYFYLRILPNRKANTTTELSVTNVTNGRQAKMTLVGINSTITLYATNDAGGLAVNTTNAWTATSWAYWRISMTGTSISFDNSPDGVNWTQARVGTSVTWGGAVQVGISFFVSGASNTPPHLTQIDSVNTIAGAAGYTVNPNGIAELETVGAPTAAFRTPLLETLWDDFNDPAVSATKWTLTGSSPVTVTGGNLNFVAVTSQTGTAESKENLTFGKNAYASSIVAKVTRFGGVVDFEMMVADSTTLVTIGFYLQGTNLYRRSRNTAGTPSQTLLGAYDPVGMQYLRLRVSGTLNYFDVSADGLSWGNLGSLTLPFTSETTIRCRMVLLNTTTAGRGVNVDAVNYFPPVETLKETFDTGTLDTTKWNLSTQNTTASITGGAYTVDSAAGTPEANTVAYLYTKAGYRLTDSSMFCQVAPITVDNQAFGMKLFNQYVDVNAYYQIRKQGTILRLEGFRAYANPITTVDIPYDPVAHAWWRIRHTGGVLYWETSPDFITWTVHTSATHAIATSALVQPYFTAEFTGPTSTSTVRLDNINNAPAPAAVAYPDNITDPGQAGTPTVTIAYTALPDSIADPETLDGPTVTTAADVNPDGILDPETIGDPTLTQGTAVFPDSATDPETVGQPELTQTFTTTVVPDSITDPETLGAPVIPGGAGPLFETLVETFTSGTLDPTKWTFTGGTGTSYTVVGGTFNLYTSHLATTANTLATLATTDRYQLDGSYVYAKVTPSASANQFLDLRVRNPDTNEYFRFGKSGTNLFVNGWTGSATITPTPTSTLAYNASTMAWWQFRYTAGILYWDTSSDGANWTNRASVAYVLKAPLYRLEIVSQWGATATSTVVRLDNINTTGAVVTVAPTSITNPETLDGPTVTQALTIYPDEIADPETLDEPAITVEGPMLVEPDSIEDPETLGAGVKTAPILYPDEILDPETLGTPAVIFVRETDNWNYGAGVYNHGPYYGYVVPVPGCIINPIYSIGTYGCGIYYGYSIPVIGGPELFADVAAYGPPLHILGIGPWTPAIDWRGAPNYGIEPGPLPPSTTTVTVTTFAAGNSIVGVGGSTSRPVLALPPTTSKGFTLRLDGGSEARTDLQMRRGEAVIIDEMDTDLWWRRKDPRTKKLEVIGRFNANNIEMATSDTGVNLSAHWEDYATVLGNRLILKYLNPEATPNPTTMWKETTLVTDILAWALPDNTGLDLSEVTGPTPFPLGGISQPYHLPPGTLLSDVFDNLEALSTQDWEWWIETPDNVNAAPKLRFAIGERGVDQGVVLFDAGSGPTPIASWTRAGATDNYANTVYYTGSGTGEGQFAGGGVVESNDADVLRYGQRDAQEGSATNGGDIDQIRAAAEKKLNKLSDRRPSYTITLTQGFWRGRSHIDVGDKVRLVLRLGKELLNEKYRVTEIDVSVDENNHEAVTLTLGKPAASTDPRSRRSPILRLVRALKNYQIPDKALDVPEDDD